MTDPYAPFTSLTFERPAPGVLRIVLDAPNLNAVDPRMHGELADIWSVVDRDAETRAVLVQGAGRAFSAGGTFDSIDAMTEDYAVRARVMREARDMVYGVLNCSKPVVSAIHGRSGAAREWMRNLRARASDGVVLVTSALDMVLHDELRALGVPLVVVDPAGSPALDAPTIGAANWSGGLAATEHLLSLGHRRIGLIAGPPRLLCSRARYDGYRAALEGAGLTLDESLVVPGDFHPESGFAGCEKLLELPQPPTAVFAASDQMALGAIEALRRRGLRVPEDMSVVGFDDLPEVRWSSPPLTTVRQPLADMGKLAVRTVLKLARGERPDSPRVELGTELVVRSSTTPPAIR